METADLPYPDTMCAAVLRMDTYTLINVHAGSPTTQVAADIAIQLTPEEASRWLIPFGHTGPVDLTAIRADPARILGCRITSIPAFARFIPLPIRAPWGHYN